MVFVNNYISNDFLVKFELFILCDFFIGIVVYCDFNNMCNMYIGVMFK